MTPNAQLRGPGGFMSTPGSEQTVLSLHMQPMGIDEMLPISPARVTNPMYPIFVGVTDESGAEPDNVCDDAPTALMTGAYLTAAFGRVIRDTPTIDAGSLAASIAGEPTTLNLLAQRNIGVQTFWPGGVDGLGESILMNAVRGAMFVVGTQFQRKFSKLLWQGNPAVNNPSKPGYLEFAGLDRQVVTGQVDALSGTAVTGLDSYVKNANFAAIGSYDIVKQLQDMEYRLFTRAYNQFGSADFVLAMRPEMWHALTEIWPIQYNTQSAAALLNTTSVSVNVNGDAVVAERDRLRQAMSLTINGRTYPVVVDDGIYEHNSTNAALAAGEYASTIYMLPLRVSGFPVLRIEHMDFRYSLGQIPGFPAGMDFWTDDGRYLWSAEKDGACFKLKARIEPRVILQAPQLAGKIERVKIAPVSHPESPDPDSPYFVDGGLSVRPIPTTYAVWKPA